MADTATYAGAMKTVYPKPDSAIKQAARARARAKKKRKRERTYVGGR